MYFTVTYADGIVLALQRRERPQLLFDGDRVYLFSTAKMNGETRETGGEAWNMIKEYRTVPTAEKKEKTK